MAALKRIVVRGFRSIRAMDLELRSLNVLIGANGAGKSNFISFFKMLNEMIGGRLQRYIAASGRAQSLLHFGPKTTSELEARLFFDASGGVDTYQLRLFPAAGDTLVFAEETVGFHEPGTSTPTTLSLGSGHQETRLVQEVDGAPAAKEVWRLLGQARVYHFHDTSPTARVRQYCYLGDNRWLAADAGNLAALLHRLRNEGDGAAYHSIVGTIRLIAPFFDDFDLVPSGPSQNEIILNWREKGSDQVFGPHQLSDGTLRAICLVALLLAPELPEIIIVDEPELGLHPHALHVVAALFKKAAHHAQILVGTQSSPFLDNFDPEDIVVVNRVGKDSLFVRPDAEKLQSWLEEYSLGEIWEKNVMAGGPR